MNWPIRTMEPGDNNYVLKTWLKFMRSQDPFSRMSTNAYSKYSSRIHGLIRCCDTHVCQDTVDPTLIYGFITFDPIIKCVHMVNVRKDFRHHHIATSLVNSAFGPGPRHLRYTAYTKYIPMYDLEQKWGLREYDPYIIDGEV